MAATLAGCSLLTDLGGLDDGAPGGDAGAAEAASDDAPLADDGVPPSDDAIAPGAPAYVGAVLADAPRAYFRFEETAGPTARDQRGAVTATFTTGCRFGRAGRVGSAVELDGRECRLSLGNNFGFAGKAPFSVELWVKPSTSDTQVRRLVSYGSQSGASPSGWSIYYRDEWVQTVRLGLATDDGYVNGPPLPTTAFTHLVMTFDGDVVRLYTNGVENGFHASPSEIVAPADGELAVGDLASGVFYKLEGLLDELAFYDKALSPARVKAHFESAPP